MADILYTYENEVYANITNKCDCRCEFCIRFQHEGLGDADTLWHKVDPTLEEIIAAIDAFDFTGYKELVYCGYGEPTCALDNLIASAKHIKEKYGLRIRINTNGTGSLYNKRDIVPELAAFTDAVSISLNAPTAASYEKVARPQLPGSYEAMLAFAAECKEKIPQVKFSVVDVIPEDEIKACEEKAASMGIPLRVRVFG